MTAQLRAVLDAYPMLPADLRRQLERDLAPLCVRQTRRPSRSQMRVMSDDAQDSPFLPRTKSSTLPERP